MSFAIQPSYRYEACDFLLGFGCGSVGFIGTGLLSSYFVPLRYVKGAMCLVGASFSASILGLGPFSRGVVFGSIFSAAVMGSVEHTVREGEAGALFKGFVFGYLAYLSTLSMKNRKIALVIGALVAYQVSRVRPIASSLFE